MKYNVMEKIRNYVGNKAIVAYTLINLGMPFVSGCGPVPVPVTTDNHPSISISRPQKGDNFQGAYEIKYSASDDKGIKRIVIHVDDKEVYSGENTGSFTYDDPILYDSSVIAKVTVYDTIGQNTAANSGVYSTGKNNNDDKDSGNPVIPPPAPSTPATPSAPDPKIYSGEREIGEKAIELLRKKYPNFQYFTGKPTYEYKNARDLEVSVDDTSGHTRDFSPDYFDATKMVSIEVDDNSGNTGYDPAPSWLPQEKHIIWVIPDNITEKDLEARL